MKSKKTFGRPHRKYHLYPMRIGELKKRFFQLKNDPWVDDRRINTMLATEFTMPRITVSRYTKKWSSNPKYDPTDTSVHGQFHRIFTNDQEASIVDYINQNYIKPGNYFSDFMFQTFIFDAYDDVYTDQIDLPRFNCSPGFIRDFKNRNNISSRAAHFRQRPLDISEEKLIIKIETFKKQIRDLIEKVRNSEDEVVVNCDETGFQILPTSIKTWAFKNTKNISINVLDSDKDRISVMASITSHNEKLPLFIIGKGECIEEAEEQLGEMLYENTFTFSTKSYMNSECFCQYLEF